MNSDEIKFGKNSKNVAKISSSNVILDTGLSYALIPSKDIKAMTDLLNSNYGISCSRDLSDVKENGANLAFPRCKGCTSENYKKVEDMYFKLGGQDFVMPKQSFLKEEKPNQFRTGETGFCNLMLAQSDMDTSGSASGSSYFGDSGSVNWLLGD
jgi:hypothetical protein